MILEDIDFFLGCKLPKVLEEKYKDSTVIAKLNISDIEHIVEFHRPFLKTDKLIIFGDNFGNSSSIGIGYVYPEDVSGHYNNTIYLALAGKLMPSTATIHLAYFFPQSSPQAVEGNSIRMDKNAFNGGLIQPKKDGSIFFVETIIIKKKLNLILVRTNIMFGSAYFGLIEDLRFVLTEKDSIKRAVSIPDVL